MDEGLELEVRHLEVDRAHVVERVLAREDDALDAERFREGGAAGVVHRHLGRTVDREAGIDRLDEPHRADVLDERGVDAAVDAVAERDERVAELRRLEQRVQREIDPRATFVGDATGGATSSRVSWAPSSRALNRSAPR